MSLFTASLNSGSNGNCYYVGNATDAVLIDAGISCRETEKRMKRLGLEMSKMRAIFISHEHGDHICGAEVIARKHQIPVYFTTDTFRESRLDINVHLVRNFTAYEPVSFGSLSVLAFPKLHDAVDPHSFVVSNEGVNVGVFTDIGSVCEHVIRNFKQCHAIYLEANYDEDMLANGRYPQHLKRRISGDNGHLSNRQALELFVAHRPPYMSMVYLSHLSKENNSPHLALEFFAEHAEDTDVIVASRYKESAIYKVFGADEEVTEMAASAQPVQMSLF